LKGHWINIHIIVAMTQDSVATRSAQDSITMGSVDKGEENKYFIGFERDYVEHKPNVNNNLVPSPQP